MGDASFELITSYRLSERNCLRLYNPEEARDALLSSPAVDSLGLYTAQMWEILRGIIVGEWFGIGLRSSRLAGGGHVLLPSWLQLRLCLNRHDARANRHDIRRLYIPSTSAGNRMSIFGGYGLQVPNEFEREREGMDFLARQAEHFESIDQYVVIVQDISAVIDA